MRHLARPFVPPMQDNAELIRQLSSIKEVASTDSKQSGVRLTQTSHKAWLDIDKPTAKKYSEELFLSI